MAIIITINSTIFIVKFLFKDDNNIVNELFKEYIETSKIIISKKIKLKSNLLFNQSLYTKGPTVIEPIKKIIINPNVRVMCLIWLCFKVENFFLAKVSAYS